MARYSIFSILVAILFFPNAHCRPLELPNDIIPGHFPEWTTRQHREYNSDTPLTKSNTYRCNQIPYLQPISQRRYSQALHLQLAHHSTDDHGTQKAAGQSIRTVGTRTQQAGSARPASIHLIQRPLIQPIIQPAIELASSLQ